MKKSLLKIVFCLLVVRLYAGGFTDIHRFDEKEVKELSINCETEDIFISESNNSEIIVVIETNKKEKISSISFENSKLEIKSSNYKYDVKDYCYVNLFIPKDFFADYINLTCRYGKLKVWNLCSKKIDITTGVNNNLSNIKANFFQMNNSEQCDVFIENLDCKSCDINLLAGKLEVSFTHVPEKESKIRQKQGNVIVKIPNEENFTVYAKSFNSKFINEVENVVVENIREGNEYIHKKGGVLLEIQTHTGDIILR